MRITSSSATLVTLLPAHSNMPHMMLKELACTPCIRSRVCCTDRGTSILYELLEDSPDIVRIGVTPMRIGL